MTVSLAVSFVKSLCMLYYFASIWHKKNHPLKTGLVLYFKHQSYVENEIDNLAFCHEKDTSVKIYIVEKDRHPWCLLKCSKNRLLQNIIVP